MRSFKAAAAIAVCSVAMLATATQAEAKGSFSVFFGTEGSKGYDVNVFANSANKGEVSISVSNKSSFATYSTKGKFTDDSISATFKGFGKVKMDFDPKGKAKTEKPPKGCTGPSSSIQDGVWEGKFSFKGEKGYTKVSTDEAEGSVSKTKSGTLECEPTTPPGGPKPCTFLSTFNGVNFSAQVIEGKKPTFSVFTDSTKNGVDISRSASTSGGTFTANVATDTATVAPPKPFKGTGEYASGNLGGSLTAELPGQTVSISGEASLSEGTCG